MRLNSSHSSNTYTLLLFFTSLLLIVSTLYVRIRLSGVPLERDEGEYAYMAQLILKGIAPYSHAYTMKLPGVALVYAIFMSLFGQSATGIHLGLVLLNAASTGLVFLLGKRLFSQETAIISAAFYSLFSLSQAVLGLFAHATHFIVFFSLLGINLLGHRSEKQQGLYIFMGGICFGTAFLMKQHAIMLIPFALLLMVWPQTKNSKKSLFRAVSLFLSAVGIPYIVVAIWIFNEGVFDRFWFWTFRYAREYATGLSLADGFIEFKYQITGIIMQQLPLWLLAGVGVIALLFAGKPRDRRFLFGYLAISFAMVCPGFYFRLHYFIVLLPPVALLAAYAATAASNLPDTVLSARIKASLPFFLLVIAAGCSLHAERYNYFILSPQNVSRAIYGTNPFPEAPQIADHIRENTTVHDRIAILGSEPEILFYADRLSATGHIYMYGLMENHRYAEDMQRQLISEIEKTAPTYIVVVHNSTSWLLRPDSSNKVLDWGDSYIPLRYDETGIVEMFDDKPTRYVWGGETAGYKPSSDSFVSIFKKRY
jgi:hypothetical protein